MDTQCTSWTLSYVLCLSLIVTTIRRSHGWDLSSGAEVLCWPDSAQEDRSFPFPACPGVFGAWIKRPPASIDQFEPFTFDFRLSFGSSFWPWAVAEGPDGVKHNIFSAANNSHGISNPEVARSWCMATACPTDQTLVTDSNCCLQSISVLICRQSNPKSNATCAPWRAVDGKDLFQVVKAHSGDINKGNWTIAMDTGLLREGLWQLIIKVRVGMLLIGMESPVNVLYVPECGDNLCEDEENCYSCPRDCSCSDAVTVGATIGALIFLLLVFVGTGCYIYSKTVPRNELGWLFSMDDLRPDHQLGALPSIRTLEEHMGSHIGSLYSDAYKNEIFSEVYHLASSKVTIKAIKKSFFEANETVKKEVMDAMSLKSSNLCQFYGVATKPPELYLIHEYCERGSLHDVLTNDRYTIPWSFKVSFALDIANGMAQLHQKNMVHGHLKSTKCLVDSFWVVKVTDFGLFDIRYQNSIYEEQHEDGALKQAVDIIYTAPEFLRGKPVSGSLRPTRSVQDLGSSMAGDVYAYSIILVEIASRCDFFDDGESAIDLPHTWKPQLPVRGFQSGKHEEECPHPTKFNDLISRCWADTPNERPSFADIRQHLASMNDVTPSRKNRCLKMLEFHSGDLEKQLIHISSELETEQEKFDKALYGFCPDFIADRLRSGWPEVGQLHDSLTVGMAELDDFHGLVTKATPTQVIAVLNKVYKTMELALSRHEGVFKVDVYCHSYMFVSGIEESRNIEHTKCMAELTLDMLDDFSAFVVPFSNEHGLAVKFALHCGPVCTGILGLNLPRYSLFGDTPVTVTHMLKCGAGFHVVCSEQAKEMLAKCGKYRFMPAGTAQLKGIGTLSLLWLQRKRQ